MTEFTASFTYDLKGYGYLGVRNSDDTVTADLMCRTGSIDDNGNLKNAIAPGEWSGRELPVKTKEAAMVVDGIGWKYRLWDSAGKRTHYLIHPDGNKPGSLGCIVPVKFNNLWLFHLLDFIHTQQSILKLTIEAEV